MTRIKLSDTDREEAVARLQQYLNEEFEVELGSFQTQFLLDFFAEQIGWQYYNQGLADALQAVERKIEEVSEMIYELELQAPDSS